MNYQNYLDKDLINQVKESMEEDDHNTFALVLINDQHPEYESVFDDLEMNHNFYTMNWKAEEETGTALKLEIVLRLKLFVEAVRKLS